MSLGYWWEARRGAEEAYAQALDCLIFKMTDRLKAFLGPCHEHVQEYQTGTVHVTWFASPIEFDQWEGEMKKNKILFSFAFKAQDDEQHTLAVFGEAMRRLKSDK